MSIQTENEKAIGLNAAAELLEALLDDAANFADVENWALEHHGFTVENLKALIDEDTGPVNLIDYDFAYDEIDYEAAVRSLNEEFGYAQHSTQVFLRTQAYTVDELGRERFVTDWSLRDWTLKETLDVYLAEVKAAVEKWVEPKETE